MILPRKFVSFFFCRGIVQSKYILNMVKMMLRFLIYVIICRKIYIKLTWTEWCLFMFTAFFSRKKCCKLKSIQIIRQLILKFPYGTRGSLRLASAVVNTEKSFRNLIKSTWNQIVFTIFRVIWVKLTSVWKW